MKIIPYGRQYIDNDDIKLVSKALKEDLITTGRYVKKFENKISKFLKVKYAVSCNSGTSALHLAFLAIEDVAMSMSRKVSLPNYNANPAHRYTATGPGWTAGICAQRALLVRFSPGHW